MGWVSDWIGACTPPSSPVPQQRFLKKPQSRVEGAYQITVHQSWAEASFLKTGRWQTAREQAMEARWGSLPLMRHNNIQIPDRLLFKLLRTLKKGSSSKVAQKLERFIGEGREWREQDVEGWGKEDNVYALDFQSTFFCKEIQIQRCTSCRKI